MNTASISSKAVLLPVHDAAPMYTVIGARCSPTRGVEKKLNLERLLLSMALEL